MSHLREDVYLSWRGVREVESEGGDAIKAIRSQLSLDDSLVKL